MKSLKNGFTLAEVLITLAIAGVVAAVAVPQLVKNHQKSQAGLTLARTVAQIETGCANYLEAKSAEDKIRYTQLSMINDITTMELARYIGLKPAKKEYNLNNYKDFSIAASFLLPAAYAAINTEFPELPTLPTQKLCKCASEGNSFKPSIDGTCDFATFCPGDLNLTPGINPPNYDPLIPAECLNNPCLLGCPNIDMESCKINLYPHPDPNPDPDPDPNPDPDPDPDPNPTPEPTPEPNTEKYSYSAKGRADIIFKGAIDTSKTGASDQIVNLIIDTNGYNKAPNMHGRDAFEFAIRNDGKVIPVSEKAKQVVADGYKIKY